MIKDQGHPAPMGAVAAIKPRSKEYILEPFHLKEAITTRKVAEIAGITPVTARQWGVRQGLSRMIGGRRLYSHPALLMYLNGDRGALQLYHQGERTHPRVAPYFERCGIDPVAVFGAADVASVGGGDA